MVHIEVNNVEQKRIRSRFSENWRITCKKNEKLWEKRINQERALLNVEAMKSSMVIHGYHLGI